MSGLTQPKPRPRYAAKREAIMAAASRVFTDHGISGFTLAAVAKRMDLHPVSLTYYFKRKEDLAAACILDTFARFRAMLADAETQGDPPARLRRFVAAFFEERVRIVQGQAAQLVPFAEYKLIGAPHAEALETAFQAFNHHIAHLLKSPDRPWLTPARRDVLARLIVDQLCWSDTWIHAYELADFPRIAARVADIMIDGIAAPGCGTPGTALLSLGAPVAQNDEITRERFLIAATDLINAEGYRGASVDKISARLNVTKGSFYHHNSDKDELALACFERTFELIDDAKRQAASAPTGWDRLWLAAGSLAAHQASGERGRMLRHYSLAALPPEARKVMMGRFQQIAHAFAGVISDGTADGSIRPVDPLLAAHLVMAMFNSAPPLEAGAEGSTLETVLADHARPSLLGFFVPLERDSLKWMPGQAPVTLFEAERA